MIDIRYIQDNTDEYKKVVESKGIQLDIDELLDTYEKRNEVIQKVESLRAERNNNTDEIKQIDGKPPQDLIEKGRELKEQISVYEEDLNKIESTYQEMMSMTPMYVSDDTPVGEDDSDNVEVSRWSPEGDDGGEPKEFDFEIKSHIELGEDLDILDLERGVKTSGFRGYYLKNEGALMQMALMQYGLHTMVENGFTPFVVPTIVREAALYGSGHFPFDEENVYTLNANKSTDESSEQKFLVGTAEPSLLNYRAEETLEESELPLKFTGFSPCYRGEVGSHGKDTKGMYRVHEFQKIEQVVICKNDLEVAEEMHKLMLSFTEKINKALEIPYRLLQICTGDMGAGKYKMFDTESWMPSREDYGETSSASNLLDWQTRRLNIKVKGEDGNTYHPYALNCTVVPSPRLMIAIWENYQNKDGSITVPEVLRPYMAGIEIIKPKK